MKSAFAKPRLLVSRCLGFEACRWNGAVIDDPLVESLKAHAEILTVCPECAIGLGVPRHPIRLVRAEDGGGPRLMQAAGGGDFTEPMRGFSREFIAGAGVLDGAILKFRSPSCGLSSVKIHRAVDKGEAAGKGAGLFAAELRLARPELPAEDEGRLKSFAIRDHFLTRVFLSAELRAAIAAGSVSSLVSFQARCKYLLMAYSQTGMRKSGRLVANHGKGVSFEDLAAAYSREFSLALAKAPKEGSIVNVLQHVFGHFSSKLSAAERGGFSDVLEDYQRGTAPFGAALAVLRSWALRFEDSYILSQYLLRPYPDALLSLCDSGKGRYL